MEEDESYCGMFHMALRSSLRYGGRSRGLSRRIDCPFASSLIFLIAGRTTVLVAKLKHLKVLRLLLNPLSVFHFRMKICVFVDLRFH